MKKYLFTLLIPVLFLLSCNKNDIGLYELRFTNNSNDRYKINLVGVEYFYLEGNTYHDFVKPKGTYYWEATQVDGYLLFPTKKNGSVELIHDQEVIIP